MAAEVEKSEKITINLGPVDLLVAEGFYANRTDFIRSAIRAQLATRAAAVEQTVARRTLTLGTLTLTRRELEELQRAGRTVEVRVLGLAMIAADVSPELALATISAVEVLGAFRASPPVKAALAPRTVRPHEKETEMNRDQLTALAEATELTRAGRLAEATALIQRTLGGGDARVRVVPGEVVTDDERAEGPPGPRCADGGVRALLRRGLDKARTHLPPDLLAHLPGASIPGLGQQGAPMPDLPGTTLHRTDGGRPYTLYVPTTGTGPRPLVVMLHGGTQTAADFAAATRMSELGEEHGVLVAYPEQVTSASPMRYWNWFEPGHQGRGGEPAILAGIVEEIAREHGVDRDRVFVAGFSAGAAMAAVLGAAYPDVFAAVGVHSGLPHGCAHDVASAFAAMRAAARVRPLDRPVPVIAFHGDADPTVVADNAARVVEQFTGAPVRGDTLVERGPGRPATRVVVRRGDDVAGELWTVHGSGHAWSGGVAGGSYTDPAGPDASAEMLRFFTDHRRR